MDAVRAASLCRRRQSLRLGDPHLLRELLADLLHFAPGETSASQFWSENKPCPLSLRKTLPLSSKAVWYTCTLKRVQSYRRVLFRKQADMGETRGEFSLNDSHPPFLVSCPNFAQESMCFRRKLRVT